ncbi:MAG: hypothetical protein UR60_C0025G0008 [Candidatus Moranbacteria bacterium GW2011_GWF2_34_56]|nr:MAG: hypothetical protein UR51_C0003G0037 [Candidatus Moranbacteria bacterium GW2011_GWF1_34_10]KKP64252.1 MAG: hypothetical protein UR60_C0025G0008 [Candidatus Moranbacteria bacterium GW2011_GWF2_34_56]
MFLYLPAIFQSIVFVLFLESMLLYRGSFWFLFFAFLILSLASFRIYCKVWSGWFIVTIFYTSIWTILHLIDYDTEKHIFILIGGLVNYFLLFGIYRISRKPESETAKSVIAMSNMAVIFLFFSASYGVYLNFDISSWILMTFYFFNIALISYQYFLLIGEENKQKILVYSLVLGFGVLEMGWVINFWPFGYLTTGVILLMFYYIIWDLSQNYFKNILSVKKVLVNLIFFIIASGVILHSSIWLPNI